MSNAKQLWKLWKLMQFMMGAGDCQQQKEHFADLLKFFNRKVEALHQSLIMRPVVIAIGYRRAPGV
jgi:hypothetical protein